MPNQPKTPHRTIRVDDHLWRAGLDKARDEGTTISEKIRQLLRDWTGEK